MDILSSKMDILAENGQFGREITTGIDVAGMRV